MLAAAGLYRNFFGGGQQAQLRWLRQNLQAGGELAPSLIVIGFAALQAFSAASTDSW